MKRLFIIFLTLAIGFISCNPCELSALGSAAYSIAYADEVAVITADNISLSYTETTYNGKEQTPLVTVKIGEQTLVKGSDYTLTYPKDTTSAGEKTITVKGKGAYSGKAAVVYHISELNCNNAELVTVEAGDCHYNGLPQYPDVTVKYNGEVIPDSEYTLLLSDNTAVSADKSATCVVKFRNNCYGERTVPFKIFKAVSQDMEIDITARAGQTFSIDLTALKREGGTFGTLAFTSSNFVEYAQPRVAFNVLNFTLNTTQIKSAMIAVPVNMPENSGYDDYWLEFYIDVVDKPVPVLSLNPVTKKYDGKAPSADELTNNGSTAAVDGNVISGEWSFVTDVPVKACEKEWAVAKFTPDDEQYSYAYGLVPITIARNSIEDFRVQTNSKAIYPDEYLELTVKGIPEDFDGVFTVSEKNDRELHVLTESNSGDELFLELELTENNSVYTVVLSLDDSALYAPFSKEIRVTVGKPEEVAERTPTTQAELAELIENAPDLSVVSTYKLTSVSAELLQKAATKKLVIENEINDVLSLVIEPALMTSYQELNLTVNSAAIPSVLLEELGDEELCSFTSYAKSAVGVSVKAQPSFDTEYPFACLYLYNTNGELEYLETALIGGKAVKFPLTSSGKFCITTSHKSRVECDLNNDGTLTKKDVREILKLIAVVSGNPTEEQLAMADFSKDGKITKSDVRYMLIRIATNN